MKIWSQLGGSL